MEDAVMRRFLVFACALASLSASAADSLTAAQIVDKTVAARGGLEAWRAVNTLTLAGQLEAGGKKNSPLPFAMKMKRSHKNRLEIQFKEQTAIQIYDGAQGWKLRPYLGRNEVEPYTPAEAKSAAAAEELDGPLVDYARKGTRIALQGKEDIEGRDAYKLKLTMKNGVERNLWIDAKRFLELKIEGEPRLLDGKLRAVSIYYRDYKTENGLTVPRQLETFVDGGKQSHKMLIERVAVNQPLEDGLFAKPQPLVASASAR
jgi:outer membrane lipoprotein-sorting protein